MTEYMIWAGNLFKNLLWHRRQTQMVRDAMGPVGNKGCQQLIEDLDGYYQRALGNALIVMADAFKSDSDEVISKIEHGVEQAIQSVTGVANSLLSRAKDSEILAGRLYASRFYEDGDTLSKLIYGLRLFEQKCPIDNTLGDLIIHLAGTVGYLRAAYPDPDLEEIEIDTHEFAGNEGKEERGE